MVPCERAPDTASRRCDSPESRHGSEDAASQTDDVKIELTNNEPCTDTQNTTTTAATPSSHGTTDLEPAPLAVDAADRQGPVALPETAEERTDCPTETGGAVCHPQTQGDVLPPADERVASPPPDRPLARLRQQLDDARGQLRSVQADCRRARHTLQQVSLTPQGQAARGMEYI